jgi:hypothetical protein
MKTSLRLFLVRWQGMNHLSRKLLGLPLVQPGISHHGTIAAFASIVGAGPFDFRQADLVANPVLLDLLRGKQFLQCFVPVS